MRASWLSVCALVLAAGCGGTELRLQGTFAQETKLLLLGVRQVEVLAQGDEPHDVRIHGGVVDLARANHAWGVANFDLPEAAERLRIRLWLDDYGGYATVANQGPVDARGAPIELEAATALLAETRQVVIELDLDRSLVELGGEERLLLPHYRVRY
jgi:hypothetical protein